MEKLKILKSLKKELAKKGFIIDGVVGSFAREENYNDIDIIYYINDIFLNNFPGFKSIIEVENIKAFLEKKLKVKVDLIAKNNMSKTAKKYMIRDLINV